MIVKWKTRKIPARIFSLTLVLLLCACGAEKEAVPAVREASVIQRIEEAKWSKNVELLPRCRRD